MVLIYSTTAFAKLDKQIEILFRKGVTKYTFSAHFSPTHLRAGSVVPLIRENYFHFSREVSLQEPEIYEEANQFCSLLVDSFIPFSVEDDNEKPVEVFMELDFQTREIVLDFTYKKISVADLKKLFSQNELKEVKSNKYKGITI